MNGQTLTGYPFLYANTSISAFPNAVLATDGTGTVYGVLYTGTVGATILTSDSGTLSFRALTGDDIQFSISDGYVLTLNDGYVTNTAVTQLLLEGFNGRINDNTTDITTINSTTIPNILNGTTTFTGFLYNPTLGEYPLYIESGSNLLTENTLTSISTLNTFDGRIDDINNTYIPNILNGTTSFTELKFSGATGGFPLYFDPSLKWLQEDTTTSISTINGFDTRINNILNGTSVFTDIKLSSLADTYIPMADSNHKLVSSSVRVDSGGILRYNGDETILGLITGQGLKSSTFGGTAYVIASDSSKTLQETTTTPIQLNTFETRITNNTGNITAATNAITALTSGTFPFSGFYFPTMTGNSLLYFNTGTKLLTENTNTALSLGGNLTVNNSSITSFPTTSAFVLINNSSKNIVQSSVTKLLVEGFDGRITTNTTNITTNTGNITTNTNSINTINTINTAFLDYSAQLGLVTTGQTITSTNSSINRLTIEGLAPTTCFPTTGASVNGFFDNIWFNSSTTTQVLFGATGIYEYTFVCTVYGQDEYSIKAYSGVTVINVATVGIYNFKYVPAVLTGRITISDASIWSTGYSFSHIGTILEFTILSTSSGKVNGINISVKRIS